MEAGALVLVIGDHGPVYSFGNGEDVRRGLARQLPFEACEILRRVQIGDVFPRVERDEDWPRVSVRAKDLQVTAYRVSDGRPAWLDRDSRINQIALEPQAQIVQNVRRVQKMELDEVVLPHKEQCPAKPIAIRQRKGIRMLQRAVGMQSPRSRTIRGFARGSSEPQSPAQDGR